MARRLLIFSALAVAVSGYFIFFHDRDDLLYILIIGVVLVVFSYTFQFQIDQLFMRGAPQHLEPPMADMLRNTAPHYAQLTVDRVKLIEDRMVRWIAKKDFISKMDNAIPEDIKFIVAYYANLLTLNQSLFSYDGIDRIAFYPHPFLSPHLPDDVHICEVEFEDGTIILSLPHLLKGHFEKGYYNIALHAMAIAYRKLYIYPDIQWEPDIWDRLEAISGISKPQLDQYMGIPVEDPWPVAVHHQVTYRGTNIHQVKEFLPHLAYT